VGHVGPFTTHSVAKSVRCYMLRTFRDARC